MTTTTESECEKFLKWSEGIAGDELIVFYDYLHGRSVALVPSAIPEGQGAWLIPQDEWAQQLYREFGSLGFDPVNRVLSILDLHRRKGGE